MVGFAELFLYFIAYSIFGWFFETIFCIATERRFVSRGFLLGPLCPIYGIGGIALSFIVDTFQLPAVLNWLMMIAVCTVIEYLSSLILEKLFKIRWWDYSQMPFNLNGRVCLFASLMFGVIGWFVLFVLRPWFADWLARLSEGDILWAAGAIGVIFVADIIVSGIFTIQFSRKNGIPMRKDQTNEMKTYIWESMTGKRG